MLQSLASRSAQSPNPSTLQLIRSSQTQSQAWTHPLSTFSQPIRRATQLCNSSSSWSLHSKINRNLHLKHFPLSRSYFRMIFLPLIARVPRSSMALSMSPLAPVSWRPSSPSPQENCSSRSTDPRSKNASEVWLGMRQPVTWLSKSSNV